MRLLRSEKFLAIGNSQSRNQVFGRFVGGVALDKEPSGFSVDLISPRNSSETSNLYLGQKTTGIAKFIFVYSFSSMKKKNLINKEFNQKYVAQFDAHADARCAVSDMIITCTGSENLSIGYLMNNMLTKFYPGVRIKILTIHPANFTCSPFHFVSF